MKSISDFCEKRLIPYKIKEAFTTYCKASVFDWYDIKGSSATSVLNTMSESDIERMWVNYVLDLREYIMSLKDNPEVHTPDE